MFVMFVMFVVSFMTEILNILDLALYHQVIPDGWKIVKINFSHQLSTFEVLNEKSKKKCRNQYNDTQTNISLLTLTVTKSPFLQLTAGSL